MTIGVKGITLKENDYVVAALPLRHEEDRLAIFSSTGMAKSISQDNIPRSSRAGKGLVCSKTTVAAAQLINDEDKILIITDKNSICVSAKDIPHVVNRDSVGNIITTGGKIVSATKI